MSDIRTSLNSTINKLTNSKVQEQLKVYRKLLKCNKRTLLIETIFIIPINKHSPRHVIKANKT